MKTVVRFIKPAVILGGLLMMLPMASMADKGGKPNQKSVATTAACIEADGSAHVYSCKALSNVVIYCGDTPIKFDDIGLDPETGVEEEKFESVFDCGDVVGDIRYIAIKSGSQKHYKYNPGYTPPADLPLGPPSGSGLFVGEIPSCADLALTPELIPMEGECVVLPTDPPPPPGGG